MLNDRNEAFRNIPAGITGALGLLESAGYEAYIVGGCVRDILLGVEPYDYDITTSASTAEIYEVFKDHKVIPTGEKHGTLTVKTGGLFTEITTFRKDGEYRDHRHPENVLFTDKLSMDLERRDFTINAMAYSPRTGVIDLFGGREDLERRVIRAVGDPVRRFDEDALRILRALRFSAKLDFDIEKKTSKAMIACSGSLEFISPERVFSELRGILSSASKERLTGIFTGGFKKIVFDIIPELKPAEGCFQENAYHLYDVYRHSVLAMANIEPDPELRLAMLLHDAGKPYVKSCGSDGRTHFKKHAEYGAEIADSVLRRFHASNETRREITTLILYHEYFRTVHSTYGDSASAAAGSLLVAVGKKYALLLIKVMRADLSAKNPEQTCGAARVIDNLEAEIYNYIGSGRPLRLSELAVGGRDLMSIGIPSGEAVGEILDALLRKVAAYGIENEKEALLKEAGEIFRGSDSR